MLERSGNNTGTTSYVSLTNETIKSEYDAALRKNLGLTSPNKETVYKNFNRYGKIFPENELSSFITYVFFVRPDLNLFVKGDNKTLNTDIANDPFFAYVQNTNPYILKSLSIAGLGTNHNFLPILFDRIESFPITDIILKDYELAQNFTGQRKFYAGNALDSTTGIRIDISFREAKDLIITQLFQAWVTYINNVILDKAKPDPNYIYSKEFDYMSSVYFFACEPDGETIVFPHKTIGLFPTTVPLSNISFNRLGNIDNRVSISFCSSFCDYFNPLIYKDFNLSSGVTAAQASLDKKGNFPDHIPIYDVKTGTSQIYTGRPFVCPFRKKDGTLAFKLFWREDV
jgi:hypothetical protein